MDKAQFLQIIQNPDTLNLSMRADLIDIAENHPYFQGVYALLAKLEDKEFNRNQAAIRTANRTVLKEYLTPKNKKKDKREIIASLNLQTEEVNAFDKFENLEELEIPNEAGFESEVTDTLENLEELEIPSEVGLGSEANEVVEENIENLKEGFNQKKEIIVEQSTSVVEELVSEVALTGDKIQEDIDKISEKVEEIGENVVSEGVIDDIPLFDEPDYLTDDKEINFESSRADTSKTVSNYETGTNNGNFFDDLSDDEFPEVNFDESNLDSKETMSFFDKITDNFDSQEKKSEQGASIQKKEEQNQIEIKKEEEVRESIANTVEKELISEQNGVAYTDFHLLEGEVVASAIEKKRSPVTTKNPEYGDYHLTPPQMEAKIVETKTHTIIKKEVRNQDVVSKVKENDKQEEGNFFDSF